MLSKHATRAQARETWLTAIDGGGRGDWSVRSFVYKCKIEKRNYIFYTQFCNLWKRCVIVCTEYLNMDEGDKYEDPIERRNLRFEYRQLITDTERKFPSYRCSFNMKILHSMCLYIICNWSYICMMIPIYLIMNCIYFMMNCIYIIYFNHFMMMSELSILEDRYFFNASWPFNQTVLAQRFRLRGIFSKMYVCKFITVIFYFHQRKEMSMCSLNQRAWIRSWMKEISYLRKVIKVWLTAMVSSLQFVIAFAYYFSIQVRRTREAALDAQLLVLVSNLGYERAQHLQTGIVTFEPRTFAEKLVCNVLWQFPQFA